MSAPIPVIVCGAMKGMANLVRTKMLPEYDVIYAGYNIAQSKHEVPQIISGNPPPPISLHTQLGSNDFTVPPRAIITGGGYSEEMFQELYQDCIKACGSKENIPVPFFRASREITTRLAAEGNGPVPSSSEYPAAITERLKNKLKEAGIGPGIEGHGTGSNGEISFF